jgi:hypothetical protein
VHRSVRGLSENFEAPFSPRCDRNLSGDENITGMNTRMRRGKSRVIYPCAFSPHFIRPPSYALVNCAGPSAPRGEERVSRGDHAGTCDLGSKTEKESCIVGPGAKKLLAVIER